MVEIQKNSREVIRISPSEYEGHQFIDLRIWYDDNGEMKPTKKGISFNPSKAKKKWLRVYYVMEKSEWDNFSV